MKDSRMKTVLAAHIVAEIFQPGDYYDSSKPAYFIRWQIDFRF